MLVDTRITILHPSHVVFKQTVWFLIGLLLIALAFYEALA